MFQKGCRDKSLGELNVLSLVMFVISSMLELLLVLASTIC
jgi:hypothetical protein